MNFGAKNLLLQIWRFLAQKFKSFEKIERRLKIFEVWRQTSTNRILAIFGAKIQII